jgi:hypothetical protein
MRRIGFRVTMKLRPRNLNKSALEGGSYLFPRPVLGHGNSTVGPRVARADHTIVLTVYYLVFRTFNGLIEGEILGLP